jgi:hypothetical protein
MAVVMPRQIQLRIDRLSDRRGFPDQGARSMEEIYSFAARVAERGIRQILIVPEEPQALLEYFDRAQLPSKPYLRGEMICVSVGRQALVEQSDGAEMVQYSVQAQNTRRGRQMWGVALAPLP